jgi:hypothetical protein
VEDTTRRGAPCAASNGSRRVGRGLAGLALLASVACGPAPTTDAAAHGEAGAPAAALELPACLAPAAPVLAAVPAGASLRFTVPQGDAIELGTATDAEATEPDAWRAASEVELPASGELTVFARNAEPGCDGAEFVHRYRVTAAFPGPAGTPDSTAVARDALEIVGWATTAVEVSLGVGSDQPALRDPERALGPAEGTAVDALALGEGGSVTLRFEPPLVDGDGPDLAVFENGFSDSFLELAFVEVSSDGVTFVRFASAYLGTTPLDAYGTLDTTLFDGLAGKYRQGYGTPFDLATLADRPEVQVGALALDQIAFVRVVDVVGDGASVDDFSHPIFDPYPTVDTAGFDLDAVAALHAAAP